MPLYWDSGDVQWDRCAMSSEQNPISSVATNKTEAPQLTLLHSVLLSEMPNENRDATHTRTHGCTDSQIAADALRIKARAVGA